MKCRGRRRSRDNVGNEQEDYYKREEDRRWREKVNHEQVSLMTGHQVLDGRLDVLEEKLGELDDVLRGNAKEELEGLLAQVHTLEVVVARLNAVIFMDSTGKKGLQHDVQVLQSGELTQEQRWKFWTAIVVAIISFAGLLLTNWDRLSGFLTMQGKTSELEQIVDHATHPKVKHRRYKIAVPAVEPDDGSDKTLPE